MKRLGIVEILVGISILLFISFVVIQHSKTTENIKKTAALELESGSQSKTRILENFFKASYDGIRTISFLPGIVNIDPLGTNLSDDAKQTIQQIYNMIYENANVSEVYASYLTLDPDKIDPATGEAYAPIFTYDEFVVTAKKAGHTELNEEEKEEDGLVEEEIYEYRLMKEQIAFFKNNYSNRNSFSGRDVPAVLGKEVVTCDNTDFPTAQSNDYFRSGLVYSVPFYGKDGKLAGIISAVFRSAILSDLVGMDEGVNDGLLYSPEHQYMVRSKRQTSDYSQAEQLLKEFKGAPLFSQNKLKIKDYKGEWLFASRVTETALLERPDSKKAKSTMLITLVGVVILSLATGTMFWLKHQAFRSKINKIVDSLNSGTIKLDRESGTLADSSSTIADLTESQAASLEEISTSLEEISSMTQSHSENANQASAMTKELNTSIAKSNEAVQRMISVINRIKESSDETSKINKSINEIAFQTNLLSLNASVEAARAGEAGAGFAVVADEVRNLALRSAKAAQDTETLITDSQTHSQDGVKVAKEVEGFLKQINESSDSITKHVDNVSQASMEQMQGIEQLNTAVSFIDNNTQKNVENVHQLAEASKELTKLSSGVHEISVKLREIVH